MDIIGLIDCIKEKEVTLEKAIGTTQALLDAIGVTLSDDTLHRIWKRRNWPGGAKTPLKKFKKN
jgi:hypothetical protein